MNSDISKEEEHKLNLLIDSGIQKIKSKDLLLSENGKKCQVGLRKDCDAMPIHEKFVSFRTQPQEANEITQAGPEEMNNLKTKFNLLSTEHNYLQERYRQSEQIRSDQMHLIMSLQKELDFYRTKVDANSRLERHSMSIESEIKIDEDFQNPFKNNMLAKPKVAQTKSSISKKNNNSVSSNPIDLKKQNQVKKTLNAPPLLKSQKRIENLSQKKKQG